MENCLPETKLIDLIGYSDFSRYQTLHQFYDIDTKLDFTE